MSNPAYVVRETAISVAINAVLSIAALLAIFGTGAVLSLRAPDNLAFDFIPQGAIIAFMSTLVPGLLANQRLKKGEVSAEGASGWPRPMVYRVVAAVAVGLVLGGGATIAAMALGLDQVTLAAAVGTKAAFGALVALVITPLGLQAAMARPLATDPRQQNGNGVI